jgi:hypothetical protein
LNPDGTTLSLYPQFQVGSGLIKRQCDFHPA